MHPHKHLLNSILRESGELLRERFYLEKHVRIKGVRDVVTDADHAVEKLVFQRVKDAGLDHHFLCEESGYTRHWGRQPFKQPKSDEVYTWVVDPIDGTSNFAHNNPIFCTSIGLQRNNEVEIAGVYLPMLDELFVAEAGQGAFLNNKRIHVSRKQRFYDLVVAVERQPDKSLVEKSLVVEEPIALHHRLRSLGSVAIDLCFVAAGRYDAFFSNSIFIWDASAGLLMIQEAGGKATHLDGSNVDLSKRKFGLAASNTRVHKKFVCALEGACPPTQI
ncbi:inositol monophosphatase [Candidatus Micrarchaeota archaeon]|nr:inositol monophosphatase [Candidatus Micrarchaeota archaeon]